MKYIKTPKSISFKEIIEKNFSLSSSQYEKLIKCDRELKSVRFFLKEKLSKKHLGTEIGSKSYIKSSTHYFMRTKALQDHSFVPLFSNESVLPMLPSEFIGSGLKKGDLLLSKDSNIGEVVLCDDDYPNIMLSGAIYNLPVKEEYRLFLFALLKHDFFREQLDVIVPKGATIRHAKTLFLDCLLPIPNKDDLVVINNLVESITQMEKQIKILYDKTLSMIEFELKANSKKSSFCFSNPKFTDLIEENRLDTGVYGENYKKFIFRIKDYIYGYSTIYDLKMTLSRGQNLQVSNIGKSIYSDIRYKSFYTLILPKYLSKYGTVSRFSYIGNNNNLKTLKKGDLIFGAEGFEKGRSFVVVDELDRTITNIHGITIKQNEEHELKKGIFIKQILDYYRSKGIIDMMSVGGNGGSLAQKYWKNIIFPNFPEQKLNVLTKLYYNEENKDNISIDQVYNRESWIKLTGAYINKSGILNLDKEVKKLKEYLNQYIDKIIRG